MFFIRHTLTIITLHIPKLCYNLKLHIMPYYIQNILDTIKPYYTLYKNQTGDPNAQLDTILQNHSLLRNQIQFQIRSKMCYSTILPLLSNYTII